MLSMRMKKLGSMRLRTRNLPKDLPLRMKYVKHMMTKKWTMMILRHRRFSIRLKKMKLRIKRKCNFLIKP